MAQLTIDVNGRPYTVGCEDGQEQRLADLGALFDSQVRQVSQDLGQLGETRLFLMAALMMADELADLRARVDLLDDDRRRTDAEQMRVRTRALAALEQAARRIERLAE